MNIHKYKCPHCGATIEDGQAVTSIMSGVAADVMMKNGHVDGGVIDIENAIVFHDKCFLKEAGPEYFPRVVGNSPISKFND